MLVHHRTVEIKTINTSAVIFNTRYFSQSCIIVIRLQNIVLTASAFPNYLIRSTLSKSWFFFSPQICWTTRPMLIASCIGVLKIVCLKLWLRLDTLSRKEMRYCLGCMLILTFPRAKDYLVYVVSEVKCSVFMDLWT